MRLIGADICRDGGSLAATFERADGSLLSIFLEVAEIPEPGEARRFLHLHVGSSIQNRCDPATILRRGSADEASFLSELDDWIAANDPPASQSRHWDRLMELRRSIPTREE